jgi:hypothetical protein
VPTTLGKREKLLATLTGNKFTAIDIHPGTDVTAGGKFNSSVNDTCGQFANVVNDTDSAL